MTPDVIHTSQAVVGIRFFLLRLSRHLEGVGLGWFSSSEIAKLAKVRGVTEICADTGLRLAPLFHRSSVLLYRTSAISARRTD